MAIKPVQFQVSALSPAMLLQGERQRQPFLPGVLESVLSYRFNQQLQEDAQAHQLEMQQEGAKIDLARDFQREINTGQIRRAWEDLENEGGLYYLPGERVPGEGPIQTVQPPVGTRGFPVGGQYYRQGDVAAIQQQRWAQAPAGRAYGYTLPAGVTNAMVHDASGNLVDQEAVEAMIPVSQENVMEYISRVQENIDPAVRGSFTSEAFALAQDGTMSVADLKDLSKRYLDPTVANQIRQTTESIFTRRREDNQETVARAQELQQGWRVRTVGPQGDISFRELNPNEASILAQFRSTYQGQQLGPAELEMAADLNDRIRPLNSFVPDVAEIQMHEAQMSDAISNHSYAHLIDQMIRNKSPMGQALDQYLRDSQVEYSRVPELQRALATNPALKPMVRYLSMWWTGAGSAEMLYNMDLTGGGLPYSSEEMWRMGGKLNPDFNPNAIQRPRTVIPSELGTQAEADEVVGRLQAPASAAAQAFQGVGLGAQEVGQMMPPGDAHGAAQQLRAAADAIERGVGPMSPADEARVAAMRTMADMVLRFPQFYDNIRGVTMGYMRGENR